jgi:hypothetical protein
LGSLSTDNNEEPRSGDILFADAGEERGLVHRDVPAPHGDLADLPTCSFAFCIVFGRRWSISHVLSTSEASCSGLNVIALMMRVSRPP